MDLSLQNTIAGASLNQLRLSLLRFVDSLAFVLLVIPLNTLVMVLVTIQLHFHRSKSELSVRKKNSLQSLKKQKGGVTFFSGMNDRGEFFTWDGRIVSRENYWERLDLIHVTY